MEIIRDLSHYKAERDMVVSIGNFDGLHVGHAALAERVVTLARERGLMSAFVSFDPHPMKFFGADVKLLQTEEMKIREFGRLGADKLFLLKFDEHIAGINPEIFVSEYLLKTMRARFIVVGYDYRFGRNRTGSYEFLKMLEPKYGFTAIRVDKVVVDGITASSSNIRKYLMEGDPETAAMLLGRRYCMAGEVVRGDGIATRMGFPTANIKVDNELIPMNGIYAAVVHIDDNIYNGALYIGERPTVAEGMSKRVEVNVFDFKDSLYGKTIEVEVAKFIRGDRRFGSVDELTGQIKIDCENIRVFFGGQN